LEKFAGRKIVAGTARQDHSMTNSFHFHFSDDKIIAHKGVTGVARRPAVVMRFVPGTVGTPAAGLEY
jgi:hypothetical protein